MQIAGKYSFRKGLELLEKEHPLELSEVLNAIKFTDSEKCVDAGMFFPKALSAEILESLYSKGWSRPKLEYEKPGNFLEGDAEKNGVGLELEFGTYSFIGWDFLGKMALFGKKGVYKYGIEIAPVASLRRRLSQGVGTYEHIKEKLEKKETELGIPTLLIGIDA